jgi:type IV pilus assembly protein PilF
MAVMKYGWVVAISVALCLGGCFSTGTSGRSPKDAAEFNMQLGVSYLRQGDLRQAQSKLEKAIEQNPGLATAHSALALVYERLGDLAGAEKHYRRAASLGPEDPDNLNALAIFLCSQRQKPEEAMGYFQRALAIPLTRKDYNRAMMFANAGICAKRNDLARAEEYLRQALSLDPGYDEALLQLADVAYSRGNYLQSRAFIERYLGAAPASASILWLGYRVEHALGAGEPARRYGERLRAEFPDAAETRLLLEQQRNAG